MWLGREFDQSPLPGAEIKNEWSYTSVQIICLHNVERDNLNSFQFNIIINHGTNTLGGFTNARVI
jgi:hypothetical protein